jgi:hypothetical protein
MAHNITFTVSERPVGNRDIEFDVRMDEAVFGTLKVSRGGIVWRPRDYRYGYFLNWTKLDQMTVQSHTRCRAL